MSNVDAQTEELFNELANAQRGEPEEAGARIQDAQISQIYGETAEHVGDLTHRMSQRVNFFRGGYEWVREKVEKTLRWLTNPYGFKREVLEQIGRNFNYHSERGDLSEHFGSSPEEALANLKRLGQDYADEHAKLTVYNDVQMIARGAAMAVGEWRFADAVKLLQLLQRVLKKGEEAWEHEAMKVERGSGFEGLHGARGSKDSTMDKWYIVFMGGGSRGSPSVLGPFGSKGSAMNYQGWPVAHKSGSLYEGSSRYGGGFLSRKRDLIQSGFDWAFDESDASIHRESPSVGLRGART